MWLYTLTTLIVCLQIQYARTQPVLVNVAETATVSASSTLVYGQTSYIPENVIDGYSHGTADTCNCCWSSINEPAPKITLLLPQKQPVKSIEIIGRSDRIDAPRILTGVNIAVDGLDMTHDQRLIRDTKIHLDVTQTVSNITITRPRPYSKTEWYLIICEIKVYSSATVSIVDVIGKTSVQTEQSSVLSNYITAFGSQNAIDGTGIVTIRSCHCCSVTNNAGRVSWWQVDLKQQYRVGAIQIFGRAPESVDEPNDHPYNEQLQGAKVYAGKTSLKLSQQHGVVIYAVPRMNTTVRGFTATLDKAIIAQFFLVKLDNDVLSLCEFKMFTTVCSKGFYGNLCTKPCNDQCHDGCNWRSGICKQGCKAGYMGPYCNITCYDPHYGRDCSMTCNEHCTGGRCNAMDGTCTLGCIPGYQGAQCNQLCQDGKYGVGCSHTCAPRCFASCNRVSGICNQGCKAGYKGPYCDTVCVKGHYGRNCSMTCSEHCINCDIMTGTCIDGCKSGYTGGKCEQACPVGFYGDQCSGRCRCKNEVDCLKNNGSCPDGCEFGWAGDSCFIDLNIITANVKIIRTSQSSVLRSDTSMFGAQNAIDGVDNYDLDHCGCCSVTDNPGTNWWQIDLGQQQLVHALQIYGQSSGNNDHLQGAIIYAGNTSLIQNQDARVELYTVPTMTDTTRHFTKTLDSAMISQFFLVEMSNNILSICEFKLSRKVCDVGRFGFGCSHVCHCYDNQTCNGVSGECQTPGCYPGWNGTSCDQECESPSFGSQCSKECHCINGTRCEHVSGHCDLEQCDPGWYGQSCDHESTLQSVGSLFDNIPVMAGMVGGGVVVLLVLIVATVVLCKRRTGSGNPSNTDTLSPSDINQPTHGENNDGTYYSEIESRHVDTQPDYVPMGVQGSGNVTYYNNESAAVYVAIDPKNKESSTYLPLEH